ncbi:MAG TPA: flavin reductase family protein, partial [Bacilli bacterium]|nr:flavin reductase family protein [Bacilli bacterium]
MAKVVFIDMKESKDFQFTENLFKNLGQDYALLTAGVENDFNTMTVGWATFGVIWGKNVITCYVRPSRFTYEFMEKNDYFTLSFYDARFI